MLIVAQPICIAQLQIEHMINAASSAGAEYVAGSLLIWQKKKKQYKIIQSDLLHKKVNKLSTPYPEYDMVCE